MEKFYKNKNTKINVITYKDDWEYTKLICGVCKRYAIFSIIECNHCFKRCCLYHKKPCDCGFNNCHYQYNVYYREL